MQIGGVGNVYIKFTDNTKVFVLQNCLYMPKIGTNLISQSKLKQCYSIFNQNTIYLKDKANRTITTGNLVNRLYYLNVEV